MTRIVPATVLQQVKLLGRAPLGGAHPDPLRRADVGERVGTQAFQHVQVVLVELLLSHGPAGGEPLLPAGTQVRGPAVQQRAVQRTGRGAAGGRCFRDWAT